VCVLTRLPFSTGAARWPVPGPRWLPMKCHRRSPSLRMLDMKSQSAVMLDSEARRVTQGKSRGYARELEEMTVLVANRCDFEAAILTGVFGNGFRRAHPTPTEQSNRAISKADAHGDGNDLRVDSGVGRVVITSLNIKAVTRFTHLHREAHAAVVAKHS